MATDDELKKYKFLDTEEFNKKKDSKYQSEVLFRGLDFLDLCILFALFVTFPSPDNIICCDGGISAGLATLISGLATATAGGASAYASGKMNKRALKFNQEEGEKNRRFQAQQAQIARQWQQEFYDKYQSPQGMLAQGLNPVLSAGGSTPPSASSGPSGSSVSAPSQIPLGIDGIFDTLVQAMGVKADVEQKEEQTKLIMEQTRAQQISNSYAPLLNDFTVQANEINLEKLKIDVQYGLSQIANLDSATAVNESKLLNDALERVKTQYSIEQIIQQTNKTILEQATESAKKANLEKNTEFLAKQILTEEAKLGMITAQHVNEQLRSEDIKTDVYVKRYVQQYYEDHGYYPSETSQFLIIGTKGLPNPAVTMKKNNDLKRNASSTRSNTRNNNYKYDLK